MKRFVSLIVLVILMYASRVTAQVFPVIVSPGTVELTARPGSTVVTEVMLRNTGNKMKSLNVSARDFTASQEMNGKPHLLDNPDPIYGIANWFTAGNLNNTLTVPGGQSIPYKASFRVPANAEPKTYYGALLFSGQTDEGGTVSFSSLVFITVGNPATSLQITDLTFWESDVASEKFGRFTAIIRNNGPGYSKPEPKLKITGESGEIITELTTDDTGGILPKSSRIFTFTPVSALPKTNLTATLAAVDQNGMTADKSLQLEFADTPAEESNTSVKNNNDAYLLLGIIPIIAMIGAANRFMAHRKRNTDSSDTQPDNTVPPTDHPQ